MNRTSRTDEPYEGELEGFNQSPAFLSADLTTNQDLNGIVNKRALMEASHDASVLISALDDDTRLEADPGVDLKDVVGSGLAENHISQPEGKATEQATRSVPFPSSPPSNSNSEGGGREDGCPSLGHRLKKGVVKFCSFIGPGFMIAVAYIDPGNYSTGVAAGATYEFRLLFVVLLANLFAIFLQTLCIKLGTVSGLNLAQACRVFLPRWINYGLYFFAEVAIIATDIAELSLVEETSVGSVFRGYLPSSAITESKGLYQACGILGATVMPHSLYLGSGIVQPRLRSYDVKHGLLPQHLQSFADNGSGVEKGYYVPSLRAIQHSYRTSAIELAIALFTFALFVNSAIVIVSGVSLYNNSDASEADIFGIHQLLSTSISSAAGTIFALALLLSGVSAGIVCTITGQMVCEGALNWKLRPWLRRLITRSISIIPSIVIAAAVGRSGLNEALNASQVVLSIVLPFVTAPLIYFTCRKKYMTVKPGADGFATGRDPESSSNLNELVQPHEMHSASMANPWYAASFAVLLWLAISALNVANLVLLGLGE
ncbi:hypothetical protein DL764_006777 [Monosporascus ibericus]|uniref:Uncharacterized protein n=1 Tax=Monosporascus ibericus TaxID=155417 RepID=A0A4Q4T6Z2_9PEZI|nr:hypothetical protein DL764_006777 [Monosporascus ibericus]